ncbi:Phage major tail protein 2 [Pseudovibrio sp. Ad13]|uniref:phage tail tube protein n=1 Tax=unclassified Pseudovibrio TaxID=2627060 RepID=UPI00070B5BE4|nr:MULTISPECIES: phage tail tube protein [unclassified Pseudovibrio]KZK82147.1 Phage major tail protein 2 [Pseudovibrio sp. Ad13]KZL01603.1 Phage major tail protein 2 [Pseudovibrio sp. Ad5]KZL17498.1 Phage major tail protein 2 [Pseudovibrio sp. WM33]
MTKPTTERFEEMVLEVDFAEDGNYARVCGLKGVTIQRQANVDETEVVDCDDESKPNEILSDVRSVKVSVSAEGTWAQESHGKMMNWFYSAKHLPVRLGNKKAASGDPEWEKAPAILSQLSQARSDGKGRVTKTIEINMVGTPEIENKA